MSTARTISNFQTVNSGSTFTESLVAMSILTITLSAMFPAFMIEKTQNINQKILAGAVNVSKETLDDLRRQQVLRLTLGQSTSTQEKSGYTYTVEQYICTQKPTVNTNGYVTCSTTVASNSNLRYIFLNVKKNGTNIYKVETVFTNIR